MYLRRCYRARDGKRHAYWALVKSVRTANGPRQQVVAYLGGMDESGRLGVEQFAAGKGPDPQRWMFDSSPPPPEPRWVEVDLSRVRVENTRGFGGMKKARGTPQASTKRLPRGFSPPLGFTVSPHPQSEAPLLPVAAACVKVLRKLDPTRPANALPGLRLLD